MKPFFKSQKNWRSGQTSGTSHARSVNHESAKERATRAENEQPKGSSLTHFEILTSEANFRKMNAIRHQYQISNPFWKRLLPRQITYRFLVLRCPAKRSNSNPRLKIKRSASPNEIVNCCTIS